MEDKPYYEQEYHEPKTDIPRPTFGQAFNLLFTAPFKWNARSTRRRFWYAYVWAIIFASHFSSMFNYGIFNWWYCLFK